jgi:hypothetical protein
MLLVARTGAPDALVDALVGLVVALRPAAGASSSCAILAAAAKRAKDCLRELRCYLYEQGLLVRALGDRSGAFDHVSRAMGCYRRTLGRLAHSLCGRLREEDVPGTRDTARMLLACFLGSRSQERLLLAAAMISMNAFAARRFADALFGRLLSDLAGREGAADEVKTAYTRLPDRFEVRKPHPYYPPR